LRPIPVLHARHMQRRLAAEALRTSPRLAGELFDAAVLGPRGFAGRAAELYHGLGDADAVRAVPAFLATGDLDQGRPVLAKAPPSEEDAPTLTAPAVRLLATIDGELPTTLSDLARAAGLLEPAGESVLLPYSPAELAAIVAA
jgi:hypothetical protein